MAKALIALDADGVLLDFHLGYAEAWRRAFGAVPRERDRLAYWPMDRWEVDRLDDVRRSSLPQALRRDLLDLGAGDRGCGRGLPPLHDAGFDLVCVSALEAEFESARLRNLRDLGFPIERVIATGNAAGERSPKADAITELDPEAFVDDYLPYMRGLPAHVHTALVLRAPNGSPNVGDEMSLARSIHPDLPDFARHWLAR
jgi:hypothetical protein